MTSRITDVQHNKIICRGDMARLIRYFPRSSGKKTGFRSGGLFRQLYARSAPVSKLTLRVQTLETVSRSASLRAVTEKDQVAPPGTPYRWICVCYDYDDFMNPHAGYPCLGIRNQTISLGFQSGGHCILDRVKTI